MPARPRTDSARRLRRAATDTEKRLWRGVREMLNEHRFRRQHPIGPYIVDFACPARKLAIELDGGQHAEQQEKDAARTQDLARRGYRVIRFWNRDVIYNLPGVLELIQQELNSGRK
jgi:very-short-patch-repair endonuclease